MKTTTEMNFTAEQEGWIKKHVGNFQGIMNDENDARRASAKLATASGETDFNVSVHHVWNGVSGAGSEYGYTVGWNKPTRPVFKDGIEPAMIDDEVNGATKI